MLVSMRAFEAFGNAAWANGELGLLCSTTLPRQNIRSFALQTV